MSSYRVRITAQAVIEEEWVIDAPDGVTLEDVTTEALELLERTPEGYRVAFVHENAVEDSEHDREVVGVEVIA